MMGDYHVRFRERLGGKFPWPTRLKKRHDNMRHIKQTLIFTLLIFIFNNSFLQDENKYRSKEEDAYYDSLKNTWVHKDFMPVSNEIAKKNSYDYVKIVKINKPSIYKPQQVFSAYWDSIMQSQKEDLKDFKKFDSIMQEIQNEKIGIIPKMSVIKQEKVANNWAIVYSDSKYDDFIYGGWGYWIALSYDNGKTWKQYYTGLTENCYYFFKRNSNIPLWKDSVTLQIESTIVRQISEVIHPLPATFETIQDSIAIQLDIRKIIQDSDDDGLTDIVENKMMLIPNNPDTDGDGIKDSEDKNPRFKSTETEKSIIYETLIENFQPNKKGEMEIDLTNPPKCEKSEIDSLYGDFESVNLFITDDKDLQGLNLHNETMIIMSSKEYEDYKKKYPSHFIESDYSQMFKCDREYETYKIHTSHLTGGATYIVKKTKTGWKIFLLSSWIS
jgi:hypothetical protein